jgi:hypothetical protein
MTVLAPADLAEIRKVLRDLAEDYMTDTCLIYRATAWANDTPGAYAPILDEKGQPRVFQCRRRDRQLQPIQMYTGGTFQELSYTTVEFLPFTDVRENDVMAITNAESNELSWLIVTEVDGPETGETKRVTTGRENPPVA